MYLNQQVDFEQAFELARKQLLLRKYLQRIARSLSDDFKRQQAEAASEKNGGANWATADQRQN